MPADRLREEAQRLLGPLRSIERQRLDNGLEVRIVHSSQAPIVVTSIWYGVGARDEAPHQSGIAHFLEHMMFKGSERYPMGAIDRLTHSLGGDNNAFTSHDVTAYYFCFAAEHWTKALDIEADRMASLRLDRVELERERQVILEEIAMYEDDPWDSLELECSRRYYRDFAYGRSILGTRETVSNITGSDLQRFLSGHYRVDNSVLVIAGEIPEGAMEVVESRFGHLSPGGMERLPWRPRFSPPTELVRLHHAKGEVPRMQLSLPAPTARDDDYPAWRLLMAVLGGGRSSRLYRRLVDEGELCSSMSAEPTEMAGPGLTMVSCELVPGVEPARVEAAVCAGLCQLRSLPPSESELERARRLLLTDWVFGMERIHQQVLVAGQAEAVLGPDYPEAHLRGLLSASPSDLAAVTERYLPSSEGDLAGVVGWALAEVS